ncbi:cell adhesion molecule CEACAM7-like [Antedon mediterranea]|uniref:cell adhesion molecule CEACAM7-like n=1 Tax=Antedon mediterranea TaxID=105859 RepID=UPI003AF5E0E6
MSTFVFLSVLFLIENAIAILSIIEGETVTIAVRSGIRNDKIHTINWFKGEEISVNLFILNSEASKSGRFSIVNAYGDLRIQNVSREDAGYYTVQVVESGEVYVETMTYHLNVYYTDFPTLTSNIKDNTDSKYIIFYCQWSNIYPIMKPNVTLIHNGNTLDTNTIKYKGSNNGVNRVVYQVSENDYGNYACRVTVETSVGIMSKTSNVEEITQSALDSITSPTGISTTVLILAVETSVGIMSKTSNVEEITQSALDSTSSTGISTTVLILAVIASFAIGSFLTFVAAGFLYKRRLGLKENKSKDNDLQYQDMQYASPLLITRS